MLRLHEHWPLFRLFGLCGGTAVVLGGLIAAGSAPARSEAAAWAAAYLVLVGGTAQAAIGAAQLLLSRRPPSRAARNAQVLLWNAGTIAVITATVTAVPILGDAGGLMLLVVLALSARAVRGAAGRGASTYRVLMALLAVSVVVGQVIARIHPLS